MAGAPRRSGGGGQTGSPTKRGVGGRRGSVPVGGGEERVVLMGFEG